MTKNKLSRAAKVRKMLDQNIKPREIASVMKMPVQAVYNIRYQYNKKKGIGALPTPASSIVVPPEMQKLDAPAKLNLPSNFPWWWVALVGAIVALTVVIATK